jgi:hypothetical protein
VVANVTVAGPDRGQLEPALAGLLERLPAGPAAPTAWELPALAGNELLVAPTQVSFVGKAADVRALGFEYRGAAAVVVRYLNASYLWERVRVQGGAYGVHCQLDPFAGTVSLTSYRDPNVAQTLRAFDGCAAFLRQCALDQTELNRAVVGAVGDLDSHQLPDAQGYTALVRHLTGVTDAYRQEIRDGVLATQAEDFPALAEVMAEVARTGQAVVLGPADVDLDQGTSSWQATRLL